MHAVESNEIVRSEGIEVEGNDEVEKATYLAKGSKGLLEDVSRSLTAACNLEPRWSSMCEVEEDEEEEGEEDEEVFCLLLVPSSPDDEEVEDEDEFEESASFEWYDVTVVM